MVKRSMWQVPLRVAAGAFILNSGLNKHGIQGEAAEGVHGFAASAYPPVAEVEPEPFASTLSKAEIGLGAALTAFGVGLNGLYWRAPGLRQEGDIRPTEDGVPIAKDVWLTGIGAALVIDALVSRRRR